MIKNNANSLSMTLLKCHVCSIKCVFSFHSVGCFDAISIKKNHVQLGIDTTNYRQTDAGKVSMVTYAYGTGGCTWKENHCGPNYCCCRAN